MDKEMVEISVEEYNELLEAYQWLQALEDAGVDNWSGYDFAVETLEQWKEGK